VRTISDGWRFERVRLDSSRWSTTGDAMARFLVFLYVKPPFCPQPLLRHVTPSQRTVHLALVMISHRKNRSVPPQIRVR
jgi:hypothetical protein